MTITAMDARKKFGELLNRVLLTNEEIIIERAGKQIAMLTKIATPQPQKTHEGKLDFRKAKGLCKEIWQNLNIETYINQERAEWE